ncbi:hypothetical protein F4861DRAFT_46384 [Xylaria intraflava]|nr:hypothetical protein F4861DRAFT_46384 [Xylaria intraflava]
MPPFPAAPLLHSLVDRDASIGTASHPVNQVVCAWPVSGQYGFGTRLLYYGFVAACVLARRKQWLRNACLAAALLLPAVAAVHAVVLAVVHVDTIVDMDIYGAFQICSIGILAAPITVYNSKTYFHDPGRNIIFLWTGLLLAAHDCHYDDTGGPINPDFIVATCNFTCGDGSGGPFSPIRQDPTNGPVAIPVPDILTFGTVTLLAAGASVPPVLTLIFTWEKILEINWKRIFAQEETEIDQPIDGTNGATPKMITFINGAIRNFLSGIQIPIFSGIVVVLLVLGEINFWSKQVVFQTEPFSSIGQWSNIVGTLLAIPGSFYFQKDRAVNGKEDASSNGSQRAEIRDSMQSNTDEESTSSQSTSITPRIATGQAVETPSIRPDVSMSAQSDEQRGSCIELESVDPNAAGEVIPLSISNKHRNKVATLLNQFSEYLGTPAADRYDNSEFRRGQREFPEIPGEAGRVADLEKIRDVYRHSRNEADGASVTPGLSRINSTSSLNHYEGGSTSRARSPAPVPRSPLHSSTLPAGRNEYPSPDLARVASQIAGPSQRRRRDTLQVPRQPRPAYVRPRNVSSPSTASPITILGTRGSPNIIVSAEPEETSPNIVAPDTSPPPVP